MSTTCIADFDYESPDEGQFISFQSGITLTDVIVMEGGWWFGTAPDGQQGYFPSSFVTLCSLETDMLTHNESNITDSQTGIHEEGVGHGDVHFESKHTKNAEYAAVPPLSLDQRDTGVTQRLL